MGNTTIQARRNEKNSWGWREGGGVGLYIKMLDKLVSSLKRLFN